FPELVTVEANNKYEINLALAISLIEKLRHIIVHKGGKVDSRDSFIKSTTENCGLYNNGNISVENLEFIKQFFGNNKYQNLITLLEIRILPNIPFDFHVNLFEKLTGYLLAYAFLVSGYINTSLDKNKA
ncbi:MAG: hypothetical protein WCT30_09015, partial [Desulfurivibrionaceae bacterium]